MKIFKKSIIFNFFLKNRQKIILLKNGKSVVIIKILLTTISIILSFFICFFVGEKYFFDELFQNKSNLHGYCIRWPSKKNLTCKKRVDEYNKLRNIDINNPNNNEIHIEKFNKEKYTIAVIGDSYVWGLGVRYSQTLPKVLQKKLSNKYSVEVISLSYPGHAIVDYYVDYLIAEKIYKPDLYIFVLVGNDAFIDSSSYSYLKKYFSNLVNYCAESFPTIEPVIMHDNLWHREMEFYNSSWTNEVNMCLINKVLPSMPNNNAIYFISDDYFENNSYAYTMLSQTLEKHDKNILNGSQGKDIEKYKKYFDGSNVFKLNVSKIERHPSVIAIKMYTDILSKEISKIIPEKYLK